VMSSPLLISANKDFIWSGWLAFDDGGAGGGGGGGGGGGAGADVEVVPEPKMFVENTYQIVDVTFASGPEDPGSNPVRVYVRFFRKSKQCCCVLSTLCALFVCRKRGIKALAQ
jgi:hypothetical protein